MFVLSSRAPRRRACVLSTHGGGSRQGAIEQAEEEEDEEEGDATCAPCAHLLKPEGSADGEDTGSVSADREDWADTADSADSADKEDTGSDKGRQDDTGSVSADSEDCADSGTDSADSAASWASRNKGDEGALWIRGLAMGRMPTGRERRQDPIRRGRVMTTTALRLFRH